LLKECISPEAKLKFYGDNGLGDYVYFNHDDLMRGDADRWVFKEVPYSEIERIVRKYKENENPKKR